MFLPIIQLECSNIVTACTVKRDTNDTDMSCIITDFVTAESGSCPVGLVGPSELQLRVSVGLTRRNGHGRPKSRWSRDFLTCDSRISAWHPVDLREWRAAQKWGSAGGRQGARQMSAWLCHRGSSRLRVLGVAQCTWARTTPRTRTVLG